MEPEMIFSLTVGQLRELLAYEDAGDLIDDVWSCIDEDDLESVGFYDDEDESYDGDSSYYDDSYDEDTDYDEDDECYDCDGEDYCDDEEDDLDLGDDEVCLGDVLPNFVEEEMAQSIAADIREGKYSFNAIKGFYADYILERIYQLI